MTKEVKNVPDLRFPGFENTWEKKKLFDILKSKGEGIKRGPFGGALKKEIFKNSGFAIYEQKNAIYDNQHFRYFIDEEKYNEMIGFAVKQGDIIMSCSGTIGKLSLIPEDAKIGIINQALIRFRTNNTILNTYFLIYMRSQYMQKKILESNPGSAITNLIPVKELKLLNFPLPNINEQQKIGEFFSKLDRQIELEEQKLAKLEEQKKGYMQQIFSQKLRFKDENGSDYPNWEEVQLKYILIRRDHKQVPEINAPLMSFTSTGGIEPKGDRYNREFLVKNKNKKYKRTEFNDLIYSSNNLDVGAIGLNRYGTSVISDVYEIFKIEEQVSPYFIEMSILQPEFMYKILRYRQGALYGQYRIHANDFLKINIELPCSEEQYKIGDFVNKLDNIIDIINNKIELLKQRKRGFLQKMFI